MEEVVRRDILQVLKQVQPAIKSENARKIKIASNMTIHNAGIIQDIDSITISVIVYALSKICNKPRLYENKNFLTFKEAMLQDLIDAQFFLKKKDINGYRTTIKKLFQETARFEKRFGTYIREAIEQSKIKRGGRLYEHGLSVGRTAQLLGISEWEMMGYLGDTKISDIHPEGGVDIDHRLTITRKVFSL